MHTSVALKVRCSDCELARCVKRCSSITRCAVQEGAVVNGRVGACIAADRASADTSCSVRAIEQQHAYVRRHSEHTVMMSDNDSAAVIASSAIVQAVHRC
jgi:hypothetical protein